MRAHHEESDGDLLAAADPEAFGVFYDRHASFVLGYFARRTADIETAADLTAETFAQALVGRHRYRPERGPARAWLSGIARHQLTHYLRRQRIADRARRRLGIPPLAVDDASLERIEALVDLAPWRSRVRDAVGELSPPIAEAVMLRVCDELPYAEVASRLGCSEGAARVRVARGLAELADRLGDDGA